jgi:hypothetical protein
MSYIGNQVTSVPFVVDLFSGDNTTTSFGPMVRAPAGTASIIVFISGVYKVPGVDYTVDGFTITFTSAPAGGTNNIVVHHIGNGVIATQIPGDGAVSGNKLQANSVRANNIVAGQISGNLLGEGAISGNNIGAGAISGNNLSFGAVSGNNISINSINASNSIVSGTITGNLLGAGAVSGNNLTENSVRGNNIVVGQVTSNLIASNLSISVSRVSETINTNTVVIGSNSASGTNVNIDILNTTVYYFSSNTTGNVTFNLRGNDTITFNDAVQVGNTVSVIVSLRHNTAAYRSGVNVMIDGGLISTTLANPDSGNIIFYSGNTSPAHSTINALEANIIGLNIIKKASDSYIVFMSNTLFGLT